MFFCPCCCCLVCGSISRSLSLYCIYIYLSIISNQPKRSRVKYLNMVNEAALQVKERERVTVKLLSRKGKINEI